MDESAYQHLADAAFRSHRRGVQGRRRRRRRLRARRRRRHAHVKGGRSASSTRSAPRARSGSPPTRAPGTSPGTTRRRRGSTTRGRRTPTAARSISSARSDGSSASRSGSTSTSSEAQRMSLYDDMGGEPALRAVLRTLYDRLFDDAMVGFLFAGKDKEQLISSNSGSPRASSAGRAATRGDRSPTRTLRFRSCRATSTAGTTCSSRRSREHRVPAARRRGVAPRGLVVEDARSSRRVKKRGSARGVRRPEPATPRRSRLPPSRSPAAGPRTRRSRRTRGAGSACPSA